MNHCPCDEVSAMPIPWLNGSWVPGLATLARDDSPMREEPPHENAQLPGLPVRRAATDERGRGPEADGRAGAAENARRRRVPLRPAHLGRLLRNRRRQEADARGPRHQAAAYHGP